MRRCSLGSEADCFNESALWPPPFKNRDRFFETFFFECFFSLRFRRFFLSSSSEDDEEDEDAEEEDDDLDLGMYPEI